MRLVLLLSSLLAIGCSAASDDDGSSASAGALSDATCTPIARAAKDKAYNECVAKATYDDDACMQVVNDELAAFGTLKDALYNKLVSSVQPAVDACVEGIRKKTCSALLRDDGEPALADAVAAQGDRELGRCHLLRDNRIYVCRDQADDATKAILAASAEWRAVNGETVKHWTSYLLAAVNCEVEQVSEAIDRPFCGITSNNAFDDAYGTCRKTCPDVAATACTPKEYGTAQVPCGVYEPKRAGFVFLTCEEERVCRRTPLCEQYDDAAKKAGGAACDANGARGVMVATVDVETRDGQLYAKGVSSSCRAGTAALEF